MQVHVDRLKSTTEQLYEKNAANQTAESNQVEPTYLRCTK